MLQTLRFAGYAKTHLKMCVEKANILANASRDSRLANVRDREIARSFFSKLRTPIKRISSLLILKGSLVASKSTPAAYRLAEARVI